MFTYIFAIPIIHRLPKLVMTSMIFIILEEKKPTCIELLNLVELLINEPIRKEIYFRFIDKKCFKMKRL
jgi:hypothetical protein